jgi:NADH/NAD ratio-sensing transcriptional regulator Rex
MINKIQAILNFATIIIKIHEVIIVTVINFLQVFF